MKVQPQAATYTRTGTAVTVNERGHARSNPRGLDDSPTTSRAKTRISHQNQQVASATATQTPQASGDVRIDGYTLWAFSDVFKGLVLDVRL